MSQKAVEGIKKELRELRLLYKRLVEEIIQTEDPTEEEKKSIEDTDEIATEEELMKTLD